MRTLEEVRGLTMPPITASEDFENVHIHIAYKDIIENELAPKDSKEAEQYLKLVDMITEENRKRFYDTVLAAKDEKTITWNMKMSAQSLISWLAFFRYFLHYYSDHYIDYVHYTKDTVRALKGVLARLSLVPMASFLFQVNVRNGNIVCVCGTKNILLQMYSQTVASLFTIRNQEKTQENIEAIIRKIGYLASKHGEQNDFESQGLTILDAEIY